MKLMAFISALFASDLYAGTPGNSDVTYIYSFFMVILVIMLTVDFLTRFLKERKARKEQEMHLHEPEF